MNYPHVYLSGSTLGDGLPWVCEVTPTLRRWFATEEEAIEAASRVHLIETPEVIPEKPYAIRDAAFEEWLEEEHPCHSVYDHETQGAYHSWLQLLQDTFNAGWKARKINQYKGTTS